MAGRARLMVAAAALVGAWLIGLLLAVSEIERDVLLAVAVPLALAGGVWAAAMPVQSRLARLYPALALCGLLAAGGAGAACAVVAWAWFLCECGGACRSLAGRLLLGALAAALFFAAFWARALLPAGGAGITISTHGSPYAALMRGFLEHGGSYDPRVSGILYGRWYGTLFPVPFPSGWRIAGVYGALGGMLALLRFAYQRLIRARKPAEAQASQPAAE